MEIFSIISYISTTLISTEVPDVKKKVEIEWSSSSLLKTEYPTQYSPVATRGQNCVLVWWHFPSGLCEMPLTHVARAAHTVPILRSSSEGFLPRYRFSCHHVYRSIYRAGRGPNLEASTRPCIVRIHKKSDFHSSSAGGA